ncbi:MAG: hypothetical protein ACAH83_06365 [Alphaproteobacteria bacterium]
MKLRFFLDSEFNEHAKPFALDPISISLVPEDRMAPDYYGVSRDFDTAKITPWLQDNVVKHLPPENQRRGNADIRDEMVEYLKGFSTQDNPVTSIEIWAYNGATDQVVMANFFGGLTNMRKAFNDAGLPRVEFRELKDLTRATGEKLPPPENAHDCHADALWARELFETLAPKLPLAQRFLID